MKKQTDDITRARRWVYAMMGIIVAVFGVFTGVYINLLTKKADKYVSIREKNQCYIDTVYGDRGNIYDCQGRLVQATFPYYNVTMDLRVEYLSQTRKIKNSKGVVVEIKTNYEYYADSVCVAISDYFGQYSHAELRKKMDKAFKNHDGNFKFVEGRINHRQLLDILEMPLFNKHDSYRSGLLVETYQNRENLYGDLGRRVIGAAFGDKTNEKFARFGIEDYFEKQLEGSPGVELHRSGFNNRPIERPVDGLDVVMTMDMDIQDKCESLLKGTFANSHGDKACMILMEVKTGEIKAMVNLKKDTAGNIIQGENYCIAYRAQPGSTIKPIALLAMLQDGRCDTAKRYCISKGALKIPGTKKIVFDTHVYENFITPKQMITWSSNCGMAQVEIEEYNNMSRKNSCRFYDALMDLGITHKIGIELNTEAEPKVFDPDGQYDPKEYRGWSYNSMPSMAYGYEILMTPLYTINFYNAIANDGYYVKPHIVRELRRGGEVVEDYSVKPSSRRLADKDYVKYIQECLLEVVENPRGTGYGWVNNDQVRIAGKTGTARMVGLDKNGIQRYMVTFVGYFPADNPKYTALVMMMNNLGNEGAPSRCGSVVRDIAKYLMINY